MSKPRTPPPPPKFPTPRATPRPGAPLPSFDPRLHGSPGLWRNAPRNRPVAPAKKGGK